MKKIILRFIVTFFTILITLESFTVPIFAQSSTVDRPFFGLIINEPIIEYSAKPGDILTGSITITNDNQTTPILKLYPIIYDFVSDPESPGSPKWIEYKDNEALVDSSMKDWVSVLQPELSYTKTGEKKIVTFEIQVPTNALAGTHQTGIIFSENQGSKVTGNVVGIISRIASLIFVNVSGNGSNQASKRLNLLDFYLTDIDGNRQFLNIFEYLPANINIDLENQGNTNISPSGDIFLNPTLKEDSKSILVINENGARILRNSKRTITSKWEDSFLVIKKNEVTSDSTLFEKIFNEYTLNLNFGKPFRLGKYTLQGKVSYLDETGKIVVREGNVDMWIIPWKMILLVILLIVIYIIIRKIRSRRKKHVYKEYREIPYEKKYSKFIDE